MTKHVKNLKNKFIHLNSEHIINQKLRNCNTTNNLNIKVYTQIES